MPLKLAALLQRSADHPASINDDIYDYWEDFTQGNKYVGLNLDEVDADGHEAEQRLIAYVKSMGFEEDAIIVVAKEWDVPQPQVEAFNWGMPAAAPIPVGVEVFNVGDEFPPVMIHRV